MAKANPFAKGAPPKGTKVAINVKVAPKKGDSKEPAKKGFVPFGKKAK